MRDRVVQGLHSVGHAWSRRASVVFTAALCVVLAACSSEHGIAVPRSAPASAAEKLLPLRALPPATEATLIYCSPGGVGLKMDLYRPTGWGAVPVVVQVHGGSWSLFNRTLDVTTSVVAGFLQHGLAFATIDYRLGNGRAAIDDVACAVRYLRAFARHLGINGSRIGAIGQSAGGQLVSLLGVTDPQAGFDVGQYLNESSRVQAVVDEWGPVIFDTTLLRHLPNIPSVFGTSNLNALKRYSPLSYLTKDDPPFLVVQGAQDTTVPPDQSTRLAAALTRAGISNRLIVVAHADHGLTPVEGTPTPSLTQVQDDAVSFFVTHLRPGSP